MPAVEILPTNFFPVAVVLELVELELLDEVIDVLVDDVLVDDVPEPDDDPALEDTLDVDDDDPGVEDPTVVVEEVFPLRVVELPCDADEDREFELCAVPELVAPPESTVSLVVDPQATRSPAARDAARRALILMFMADVPSGG